MTSLNDLQHEESKLSGPYHAVDLTGSATQEFSKKDYLESLILIQEEERKKLGQELHDSVNCSLTIAKFYLSLLPAGTEQEKYAKEQLAYIISTTEQNIRTISCEMVVFQETGEGLIQLLENLIGKINDLELFRLRFRFNNRKFLNNLPDCQKIVLYRIVQEQLNNTIKYSKASEVIVAISYNRQLKNVKLSIKDNGVGFDSKLRPAGIGLSNIRNRIKQFNGTALIQSAPGKGCKVEVSMPVLE